MTLAVPLCRSLLALLSLGVSASAPCDALARGYRCPSGQYWRPSLGVCQDHPYASRGPRQRTRTGNGLEAARRPAGHPVVTTDTQVIPGDRVISGGHLVLRYVVQTSVVEKY